MLAISCVFDSITVSMMRSRLARSDEPVSVTSTMASASIGGLTSVAPHENSTFTWTPCCSKYARVARTSSVATVLPSRSGAERIGRVFGCGEDPPDLPEALLRVDQIGERLQHAGAAVAGLVLGNPVLAGQAGVEDAVRDVARHLLRADQHALDLRIVDRREVRARAHVDVEAGPREQLNGRVLERAFRDAELQLHFARTTARKKQLRSPV